MSTRTRSNPLTRFWLALEQLPGQAAVATHWQYLIRSDWDRISHLLSPDSRLASAFPRLDAARRYYTVIEHGPEDFVGLCEEDGDQRVLTRSELIIYRLDSRKFLARIAVGLGVTEDGSRIPDLHATYHVGSYQPLAGFSFPIYFTIQREHRDYQAVVESLLVRTPGAFILLAPTNHHHRLSSQLQLQARSCLFLPLADAIRAETDYPDAQWELTDSARRALDAFSAQWIPATKPPPAFFPTPVGATWSMLRIRFLDGHRVTVRVGGVTQTLNYTQLGMADGRNGNPTKQWELLRTFAESHGRLTWSSKGASRENQKRKENLAEDLIQFFRMDGDPFRLLPGDQGWETVFDVEPDV